MAEPARVRRSLITGPGDEAERLDAPVKEPLRDIMHRADPSPEPPPEGAAERFVRDSAEPAPGRPSPEALDRELGELGTRSIAERAPERPAETPPAGRAAAAAIGVAIEHVATDVRAKLDELHRIVAQVDREAEEFIAEMQRRGLALQDRIEGFTLLARSIQASIKSSATGLEGQG